MLTFSLESGKLLFFSTSGLEGGRKWEHFDYWHFKCPVQVEWCLLNKNKQTSIPYIFTYLYLSWANKWWRYDDDDCVPDPRRFENNIAHHYTSALHWWHWWYFSVARADPTPLIVFSLPNDMRIQYITYINWDTQTWTDCVKMRQTFADGYAVASRDLSSHDASRLQRDDNNKLSRAAR